MIGVYFSGTGNTQYCIARFLHFLGGNAPVISIEDPQLPARLREHTELVLAYPIYFSSLPKIVKDFLEAQAAALRGKRVFVIATMGLFSGDGAGCAARLLRKYGAEVVGGLHIKMPDCVADVRALKRTRAQNVQIVEQASRKLESAARAYQSGRPPRNGLSLFSHAAGLLTQRLWFFRKTQRYSEQLKIAAAKCTGCGACVQVCPMKNLRLSENHAMAGARCTMCYRCIHRCPNQAITLLGKQVICQDTMEDYL